MDSKVGCFLDTDGSVKMKHTEEKSLLGVADTILTGVERDVGEETGYF